MRSIHPSVTTPLTVRSNPKDRPTSPVNDTVPGANGSPKNGKDVAEGLGELPLGS
jgi:hypothetical protein